MRSTTGDLTAPGPGSTPGSTVPAGSTETWKDKKRYLWLIGLVVPSLAFVGYGLHELTGWAAWFWLGPIVVLGVVPTIDLVAGLDKSNPPDDVIEALEKDKYYRWITYLFLPIQYAGFVGAFWLLAHGDLATLDKVGLAMSIGTIGGIGINTAHELGHKREQNERWLSKIALAQSFYGHFYIEHNRGHHVRVATPADPASSRVGENFYQFWPRTVSGSLRSAWNLEKRRYARRNKHPFRLGNDVINAWLMSAVLWGALIAWLGVGILPYLLLQALVGFSLLEVVNYMEHYGMLRQKVGEGHRQRYERVDPSHSWNSNNIATNVLLYHLQRHSDHHANPTRRYQTLRDFEESPVLPTGYAGMIVLALFPPLWRRVMDPRVLAHFDGDISRANISPRKREKVLARYAPAATPRNGAETAETDRGSSLGSPREREPEERSGGGRGVVGQSVAEENGLRRLGDPTSKPAAGKQATSVARSRPQPERVGLKPQPEEILAARCPGCGFTYEVEVGCEHEGFAAGTAWADVPDDWCCPDCGVREKVDFVPVVPETA